MVEETREIRLMDAAFNFKLSNLLDMHDGWKKLMISATVDCDPTKMPKYTYDDVKCIELAGETQRRSRSEIFLEEWGTSGKFRPNLKILKKLLVDAGLIRAAEYVTSNILIDKSTEKSSLNNSKIDISRDDCENYTSTDYIHEPTTSPNLDDTTLCIERFGKIKVPYKDLFHATEGFSDSCLIGTGGFSKVFKAKFQNQTVAIKRMEKIEESDFNLYLKEIDYVLKFKHNNLLLLLGISLDEQPCVIYEFMENGSLLNCIACKSRSSLLDWKRRIKIGTDVAEGLFYLHTAFERPFIHRDIKTANILLDNSFIAKIGDFGLIRFGDHTKTSLIVGTTSYMSPEALRGDISEKIDVFSFGVVLLELLTGLVPYDESRDGCDLPSYFSEINCNNEELLDGRAGDWNIDIANRIFDLALLCITYKKSQRPFMHGEKGAYTLLKNILSEIDTKES